MYLIKIFVRLKQPDNQYNKHAEKNQKSRDINDAVSNGTEKSKFGRKQSVTCAKLGAYALN